jgi:hypothetical protein
MLRFPTYDVDIKCHFLIHVISPTKNLSNMFQKKKRRSETATAELEHFVATGLEVYDRVTMLFYTKSTK